MEGEKISCGDCYGTGTEYRDDGYEHRCGTCKGTGYDPECEGITVIATECDPNCEDAHCPYAHSSNWIFQGIPFPSLEEALTAKRQSL